MFLRNDTPLLARLSRGHLGERVAIATVVIDVAYRIGPRGLDLLDELPEARPTDPPDVAGYVVWEGVSVTAAGDVEGPSRAPFVRQVTLEVAGAVRRLAVLGDRVWARRLGGGLDASDTRPFDVIPLSFARAFGGKHAVPPGRDPAGLPHPGFEASYTLNPYGVGFYRTEADATGAPLPNIERPEQLLRRWSDTPEPAGFSPCPDLAGLRLARALSRARLDPTAVTTYDLFEAGVHKVMPHHAPGDLVIEDPAAVRSVKLDGLVGGPIAVTAPAPPCGVLFRRGPKRVAVTPKLRTLHLDASARTCRAAFDAAIRYDPERPARIAQVVTS
ncbi:MAG TPA: DUF2169 domain-containing protein [Byssovorax sp.]|jgi:hypothetical protein